MKRPFRAKSVADILNTPDGVLKSLLDQANSLKSINDSVIKHLPAELREHCSVSSYDQQTLILVAKSAVWGTRLRYHSAQLLSDLRSAGFYSLANILIQIRPNEN